MGVRCSRLFGRYRNDALIEAEIRDALDIMMEKYSDRAVAERTRASGIEARIATLCRNMSRDLPMFVRMSKARDYKRLVAQFNRVNANSDKYDDRRQTCESIQDSLFEATTLHELSVPLSRIQPKQLEKLEKLFENISTNITKVSDKIEDINDITSDMADRVGSATGATNGTMDDEELAQTLDEMLSYPTPSSDQTAASAPSAPMSTVPPARIRARDIELVPRLPAPPVVPPPPLTIGAVRMTVTTAHSQRGETSRPQPTGS
jgi:hypothetical protein